jgi:hypothetical protein
VFPLGGMTRPVRGWRIASHLPGFSGRRRAGSA